MQARKLDTIRRYIEETVSTKINKLTDQNNPCLLPLM